MFGISKVLENSIMAYIEKNGKIVSVTQAFDSSRGKLQIRT